MDPINLGRKWDTSLEVCAPCPPTASKDKEPEVHYPSLYIDGVKDLPDFPDEGTITVRFKKVRESKETYKGKKTESCSLDIIEILDVSRDQASKGDDREAELDRLAKEEVGDDE
ncbi:MAG TPA: hypothetical protein VEH04_16795 [Verrucomicrobiae bacterium]|nr:hypothetical protein [Verrucomicrobiae bacterium]